MITHTLFDRAEEAAAYVRERVGAAPKIAVVLGSGLNPLADRLEEAVAIDYAEIPHFPATTVEGHRGRLVVGLLGATRVLMYQGRFHHYEGHDLDVVTFPIRVLQRLGARSLILTAATGGIRDDLRPGDVVIISDHLNLLGKNPLFGPNDPRLGVRFLDLGSVYSPRMRGFAVEEATILDIDIKAGVYACLPGPSYETPAEIRMLRTLGADVVGMSTVPEAIVARHAGLEVLSLALVTNAAAGATDAPITHDEIVAAGLEAAPRLGSLIECVVMRLDIDSEPAPPPP